MKIKVALTALAFGATSIAGISFANAAEPGSDRTVADLKAASYVGGGSGQASAQTIIDWVGQSKYKIYATYTGNDWKSYGPAGAGWVDDGIGLALPVAYDGTRDQGVGDYTNESFYARYAKFAVNYLKDNPNLSQRDAGLVALSRIKRDCQMTGRSADATGFDMGSVPDGYGQGSAWH